MKFRNVGYYCHIFKTFPISSEENFTSSQQLPKQHQFFFGQFVNGILGNLPLTKCPKQICVVCTIAMSHKRARYPIHTSNEEVRTFIFQTNLSPRVYRTAFSKKTQNICGG